MPKPIFEECIDIINNEINKRKKKWNLKFLSWLDFDDVSQIIRIHIHKKWYQYDETKPLAPWLNRIITNQMKNLIRNVYGNYSKPCMRCAAFEGEGVGCRIHKPPENCPIYSRWVRGKKNAHDIKLPISLDTNPIDIYEVQHEDSLVDIEKAAVKLHQKMLQVLRPTEWKVYKMLYVDHLSDEKTAQAMGYKTNEKNRSPGYKQLKNIKKSIILKVRKLLQKGDVDLF